MAVQAKIVECITTIENKIEGTKISPPVVLYDLKGHTAGQAIGGHTIRLNLELLNGVNRNTMLNQTLPHEMAHIAVAQLWPKENDHHGPYWQFMMEHVLELPAERCHQYETKAARVRKKEYAYDCGCDEPHMVTKTIHTRIQMGKKYRCKKCGRILW
jgi:SprT protein